MFTTIMEEPLHIVNCAHSLHMYYNKCYNGDPHLHRGVAIISYLRGRLAKLLYSGIRLIMSGPPLHEKVKCCNSETRKMKSSIRAKASPTQARFPGEVHKHKTLKQLLTQNNCKNSMSKADAFYLLQRE